MKIQPGKPDLNIRCENIYLLKQNRNLNLQDLGSKQPSLSYNIHLSPFTLAEE